MKENGWERHQEHVLSELRRLSDKLDSLDDQMTLFHTNHLHDIKVELTELRTTMKFFCAMAITMGPFIVGVIEVVAKFTGK
tara:strand:- start:49 stop:291 length:243 start_codon:yes stop_codon:yes gene_type:complete